MAFVTTPYQLFSLEEFPHAALFTECVHAWEALIQLETYLSTQPLGHIAVDIPAGVHLIHPELISIGTGTIVEPGAYIQGPCVIGKNCVVRHGAYIRGHVLTGDGCVIGHDTELKNAIFLNGVSAAHFNYVGDSILGNRVNLGAGAKCANVRLDRRPISVWIEGERFETRLKKLGAILGDGAQVGCNCVLNPGTVMGKNASCFPCLNISGFVPQNQTVKTSVENIDR